jgi:hypothetical protein
VTIGIGFMCRDGILLSADTQITWPQNHKYYESKLYYHQRINEYSIALTFAGNPNLAKSFFGKLPSALDLVPSPVSTEKLQNCIESLLSTMDLVESDQDGLHMMIGIIVLHHGLRLLKTERKVVSEVRGYDYVGVGDSSLLRYLSSLTMLRTVSTTQQALALSSYLILQAKRYVDGCGGETEAFIMRRDGSIEACDVSTIGAEHHLTVLEKHCGNLLKVFFDPDINDDEFEKEFLELGNKLKMDRHKVGI